MWDSLSDIEKFHTVLDMIGQILIAIWQLLNWLISWLRVGSIILLWLLFRLKVLYFLKYFEFWRLHIRCALVSRNNWSFNQISLNFQIPFNYCRLWSFQMLTWFFLNRGKFSLFVFLFDFLLLLILISFLFFLLRSCPLHIIFNQCREFFFELCVMLYDFFHESRNTIAPIAFDCFH